MYYGIAMCTLLLLFFFFGKTTKYRQILIVFNSVVCLAYISWRITAIPIHNGIVSFVLGVVLYLAELLGLVAFFNFQYLFIGRYHLEKKTLEDFGDKPVPFVDVLICTYNEPLSLLEMTILGAKRMDYPKDRFKVHICDDGKRPDLEAMCRKYGIGYITRDGNEGAKAGNINNALGVIQGDLFAVLDADMIPTKNFLKHTVGYFNNENLAFVQTPQVYYNMDMYQYNLHRKIPNEQDFFMRDIQEARASRNAVLHVGTNAVFRREYVLGIGGYPTCSITEDMAVGMLLQAQGYDSVLVNEELVYGLSATTFVELVKQRDRWCRGNIQVLKHYNFLFMKGLTFAQKIAYLDGALYWFANLQKMVFMLCPVIYLLTETQILNADLLELLNVYTPYLMGQLLMFHLLSPKTRSMKWAHYYETIMAPHLSLSIIKELLNLKIKFNVTSKEVTMDKKHFQARIVLPHIVIFVLTLLAWFVAGIRVGRGDAHIGSYLLNFFWSVYNMMGIVIALRVAWQKPIFRSFERIHLKQSYPVLLRSKRRYIQAEMLDISNQGSYLKLSRQANFKEGQRIYLCLNEKLEVPAHLVRAQNGYVALQFDKMSEQCKESVMELLVDNLAPHYKVARPQKTL